MSVGLEAAGLNVCVGRSASAVSEKEKTADLLLVLHSAVAPLLESSQLAGQVGLDNHFDQPRNWTEDAEDLGRFVQCADGCAAPVDLHRALSTIKHAEVLAVSHAAHGVECEEADPFTDVHTCPGALVQCLEQ